VTICFRLGAALLLAAALLMSASPAAAHGHAEVGECELVIGFRDEPAYQGEPNGLSLTVTRHESGEPVNDLADTLRAEISFGAARQELALRPAFGEEGAYTADVLPTEAGDYTFRIFGDIERTPVDVTMSSSPDTFSAVQSRSTNAFPAAEPSAAELRAQAAQAAQLAQLALGIGALGALLGVAGLVVGLRRRTA
jgi:hypothetical protein